MRPTRAVLIFAIVSLFGLQYLAWRSLHASAGRADPSVLSESELASVLRPEGGAGVGTEQGVAHSIQLPLSDTHTAIKNTSRSQNSGETVKTQSLPPKPFNEQRIFVSIASYRDFECPITLASALSNASNPARVMFGIVQQNLPEDVDCVDTYCAQHHHGPGDCPRHQFKTYHIHAANATGVTVARALAEGLLTDEEFFMQVDAHVLLAKSWDARLIAEWASLGSEYAMLTTYTMPYDDIDKVDQIPHICKVWFEVSSPADVENIPHFRSWIYKTPERPRLGLAWAAGFSFSRSHAVRAAPYDPFTLYVFHGEEYSKAARLWTHGYDFYSPTANYVVHNYARHKAPRIFTEDFWKTKLPIAKRSSRRVKYMLGIPNMTDFDDTDLAKYSLGTNRTMEEFVRFSGIDPLHKVAEDRCDFSKFWPSTVPVRH